jgi:hypothetical protein
MNSSTDIRKFVDETDEVTYLGQSELEKLTPPR